MEYFKCHKILLTICFRVFTQETALFAILQFRWNFFKWWLWFRLRHFTYPSTFRITISPQTNTTYTKITIVSGLCNSFKSFWLWMESLFVLMYGQCRLCEGTETDPECTEVWIVKPGSCEGNPVEQKDDVFSCKMAPWLRLDSRVPPLTEHRPGLESKMVTPQVSEFV